MNNEPETRHQHLCTILDDGEHRTCVCACGVTLPETELGYWMDHPSRLQQETK